MKFSSTLLVCALAMPLAAQEIEPPTLGLQIRGSIPQAGLAEVVGDSGLSLPGLGASLVVEVDLEEGYRARVVMGGDRWDSGDWSGRPGIEGKVSDFHLGVEGVWMLRSDESPSWGPYLVAGLAGYVWSVGSRETATGVTSTRRILHAAGTFGIGFRLARSLDVELRALGGRIDPDLFGAAIQLGVTYRF
jgi:hypothetical protein